MTNSKSFQKNRKNNRKRSSNMAHPYIEGIQAEFITTQDKLNYLRRLEEERELTDEEKLDKVKLNASLDTYHSTLNLLNSDSMKNKLRSYSDSSEIKHEKQILLLLEFFFLVRLGQLGQLGLMGLVHSTGIDLASIASLSDKLVGAAVYHATTNESGNLKAQHRSKVFEILHKLTVGDADKINENHPTTYQDVKNAMQHLWDHTFQPQNILIDQSEMANARWAVIQFDGMISNPANAHDNNGVADVENNNANTCDTAEVEVERPEEEEEKVAVPAAVKEEAKKEDVCTTTTMDIETPAIRQTATKRRSERTKGSTSHRRGTSSLSSRNSDWKADTPTPNFDPATIVDNINSSWDNGADDKKGDNKPNEKSHDNNAYADKGDNGVDDNKGDNGVDVNKGDNSADDKEGDYKPNEKTNDNVGGWGEVSQSEPLKSWDNEEAIQEIGLLNNDNINNLSTAKPTMPQQQRSNHRSGGRRRESYSNSTKDRENNVTAPSSFNASYKSNSRSFSKHNNGNNNRQRQRYNDNNNGTATMIEKPDGWGSIDNAFKSDSWDNNTTTTATNGNGWNNDSDTATAPVFSKQDATPTTIAAVTPTFSTDSIVKPTNNNSTEDFVSSDTAAKDTLESNHWRRRDDDGNSRTRSRGSRVRGNGGNNRGRGGLRGGIRRGRGGGRVEDSPPL